MRCVVVGAGLAGLTAAADLRDADAEVTVLEARDRVGGRTHGIEVAPGGWVDAGAAYLGDRHTSLHDLIGRLGLKTTPTNMVGDSRFLLDDDEDEDGRTRHGRFPPLNAVALGEMFDLLEELTATVRPDAPWLTPEAGRLDRLTAHEWADEHLRHRDARLFFPLFIGEMMAADPAAVSMLHVAFYLRSGGGIRYLNAFEGGAQSDRVDGGAHQVCEQLATRLDVRLEEEVLAVHQDGAGATVHTGHGRYGADAVVVALPPLLADQLEIPGLPHRRAGDELARGCTVKVNLVYPRPLWRERGLSGWSVNAHGPLLSTVDDSPAAGGAGVLTGFVTGAEAHRYAALTRAEQRAETVAQAGRVFPDLPEPVDVHITDWTGARYSKGCYAALFGPGEWLRLGPHLTTPHGRIHWAGTETSTEYFGLMEGAIRSGHRAATEVNRAITQEWSRR